MLSVETLSAGYGAGTVISDLDLKLEAKQTVIVVGRNGVGKSTMLKAIAGVLPSTKGTVLFDGVDLSRRPGHARADSGISYIAQGKCVSDNLSVRDNIASGTRVSSMSKARRIADEVLERDFPALLPKQKDPAGSLSGGQQKLLALARALAREPKLLLLDEPTEGVQPSLVDALAHKLATLRDARGLAILLVEQRLDFAATVGERALVLVKGEIVDEVATADLRDDQELQRRYLGV
jgi:ABC-type branched-subunit amino acid transport system ATPase component